MLLDQHWKITIFLSMHRFFQDSMIKKCRIIEVNLLRFRQEVLATRKKELVPALT